MRGGDYDATEEITERARWVLAFRERVEGLQREWDEWCHKKMSTIPRQKSRSATMAESVAGERLHSGRSTPADGFRRVILEALVERGGSAPCGEVLRTRSAASTTTHRSAAGAEPLDPGIRGRSGDARSCRTPQPIRRTARGSARPAPASLASVEARDVDSWP